LQADAAVVRELPAAEQAPIHESARPRDCVGELQLMIERRIQVMT